MIYQQWHHGHLDLEPKSVSKLLLAYEMQQCASQTIRKFQCMSYKNHLATPKSFWKILFCKSSNKSSNSNTERNQHTLFFNCACSLHPNLDDFVTLNSTEEMKTQPASRLQMCSMFMPVSLPWMHQGTLHIVKKKGGQKGSRFSCSLWLAKVNTDAWMKWLDKLAELIQSRLVYIGPPLNTTCHLSARNM